MRARPPICPESEESEDAETDERVRDPHGENLRWAKREQSKQLNRTR
jgi:hypothetical protein